MRPADLTLALVTDLHFGPEARWQGKLRKLSHEAGNLARAFVGKMNDEVKPDLVVNLGDDIEDESLDADRARYGECQAILKTANADLLNVAGNHDTVNLTNDALVGIWGKRRFEGPEGELYGSFDLKDHHVVVLHTRERRDVDISIGEAQLAWLEADLSMHVGPTLVFMHHSAAEQDLTGNRWFEGDPHRCLVRERRSIRALFRDHGDVLAVFNGHLHWNHVDVIDGIPFVTVQSLIENLDDDAPGRPAAAHAIVRITKHRLVIEIEGAERARYQIERRDPLPSRERRR